MRCARSPFPKGLQRSRMKPNTKPTINGMPIQSLNTASSLAFSCIRFFKKKVTGMSMTPAAGLAKFIRISKTPPNRKVWRARTPESGGAKARELSVMPDLPGRNSLGIQRVEIAHVGKDTPACTPCGLAHDIQLLQCAQCLRHRGRGELR